MSSAPWDGSGIIEVEGRDDKGGISNGLLINYFCGRNTYINTNIGLPNGCGIVSMGRQVEIGVPTSDNTVNLNIKSRNGIQRAIQVTDLNDMVNFTVKPNGVVYAREINVQTGQFPDYVFNKDYKLTPLNEVEAFIAKNKHLQGFEKATKYEQNGMPLGEIVRLQQEKIEELTLYLIELKKEINNLKK